MATDFDYCPQNLGEHELIQCGNWLFGSVDGLIIFKTDAVINDYTVKANWTSLINIGDAMQVKNINGEFPDGSPTTGESPIGGLDTILDGADFDFPYMDYNVNADNDAMYANINGGIFYFAVHCKATDELWIVEQPVTVEALPANIPKSKKEKQRYNVHLKWVATKDWYPIRIDSPSGLF